MTLHAGQIYRVNNVSIGPPDATAMLQIIPADDVVDDLKSLSWAQSTPTVYYFLIYENATLVGQIYLHDIDVEAGEAMLGYHLFRLADRGRGIGRCALGLLQRYVMEETAIQRLIIITGRHNGPSCSIAARSGFVYIGGAREAPEELVVYKWTRPLTH